jgi:hypothetical protein
MPFMVANHSLVDALRNAFLLGCVSAVYYWRGKTEERHLLGEDPKYADYSQWMARYGLVTAPLTRLSQRLTGRRLALAAAE